MSNVNSVQQWKRCNGVSILANVNVRELANVLTPARLRWAVGLIMRKRHLRFLYCVFAIKKAVAEEEAFSKNTVASAKCKMAVSETTLPMSSCHWVTNIDTVQFWGSAKWSQTYVGSGLSLLTLSISYRLQPMSSHQKMCLWGISHTLCPDHDCLKE